jgi:AcrR family transcriptional regulator
LAAVRRDSEKTRVRIIRAARRLFAERDIASVGIRDIASAAGVSHGLVQRYCGTREQMIAQIVRQEVERFSVPAPPVAKRASPDGMDDLREVLKTGMHRFEQYARIIARAELAGLEPGSMLDPGRPTPAMQLTASIRRLQSRSRGKHPPLDPALVSAYVNASLFAFGALSPWLMAAVGLDPEDFENRLDEIADISVRLIALAAGVDGGATGRSHPRRGRKAGRPKPANQAARGARRTPP